MNETRYFFTSESVAAGHSDKLCDQISDAILDLFLQANPSVKAAIETMATAKKIIVAGEVSHVDAVSRNKIEDVVRHVIKDVGYKQKYFHWRQVDIEILFNDQPLAKGAVDQGVVFGFACDETPVLMPASFYYANQILINIFSAISNNELSDLGPDAKSQVTLLYEQGMPVKATSIIVSIQHKEHLKQKVIKELIYPYVVRAFPDASWMCEIENFLVNPTGLFIIGGPESDTGLTGRKIIIDTYGTAVPHGGGAFSGKDPTKTIRSAAYVARYIAKNIVAANLATKCTIQIAYAIGFTEPLSFYINTHQTAKIPEERLAYLARNIINLTPSGIIDQLKLNQPIYRKTASYGHFGRYTEEDGSFSWEKTDLIEKLLIDW